MGTWFDDMKLRFYMNFIKDDRWRYLSDGLFNTVRVAFFAVLIGVFLGFIISVIRSTHDMNEDFKFKNGILNIISKLPNLLCKIYLSFVRGTPVMLQILILNFIVFSSSKNKILVASIAFGLNSAAYVAEIFRAGIMSIDKGQFEAGRSLGFNYYQTMFYIIMPQAFKNVLPAIGNEFIVLLKETAISGYIALQDLTKGAEIIRSVTYDVFMPLIAAALIYWVFVAIIEKCVNCLERRLRSSDH